MPSKCTWVDCENIGRNPQCGSDGSEWANLCDEHAKELDSNLMDSRGVLRCWIRAQGGPRAMTDKIMSGPVGKSTVKLAEFLQKKQRKTLDRFER